MATLGLCSIPLPQVRRHARSSSDTTGLSKATEASSAPPRDSLFKLVLTKFSSTPLQETEYSAAEEQLFHQAVVDAQEMDPVLWRMQNEYPHDASLTPHQRNFLLSNVFNDANSIQTSVTGSAPTSPTTATVPVTGFGMGTDSTEALVVPTVGSNHSNHCILDEDEEDDDDDDGEETAIETTIETAIEQSVTENASDSSVPLEPQCPHAGPTSPLPVRKTIVVRDSMVQQELFRVHETEDVAPSHVLQRMQHQNSILASSTTTNYHNSIVTSAFNEQDDEEDVVLSPLPDAVSELANDSQLAALTTERTTCHNTPPHASVDVPECIEEHDGADNAELLSWNPFEDISSWLDGGQGIEVTGSSTAEDDTVLLPDDASHDGLRKPKTHRRVGSLTMVRSSITTCATSTNTTTPGQSSAGAAAAASTAPFRILGTGADDVSCHPHVLSPPLMESVLAFVPEYTGTIGTTNSSSSQDEDLEHSNRHTPGLTPESHDANSNAANTIPMSPQSSSLNFWLKYSLVRDGPNLLTFLRQVRTSTMCVLAIETDEGHVFGAFTSQPWRLSKGWYGSKDTFLWKMRRSRLETAGKSIVQQVCQESEIQVYPYRTGNAAVQYCSKECLMLGQGEIIPSPRLHNPDKPLQRLKAGSKHYGYALYLDKDLTTGTTSSSETFGNPCLIDPEERGARFYVSNIEVWTLTPHDTVAEAEQSELSNLFLDGGRDNAHRLNFMNILVGGPI